VITKNCEFCDKLFESYEKKKRRFCNISCSRKWLYKEGYNLGFQKEHKTFLGTEKTRFKKGQTPWNKGIRYVQIEGDKNPAKRPEVRAKIVKAKTGMKYPSNSMEKHHNWRGGTSFEPYPKEFFDLREEIISRDNNICQLCFFDGMFNNKKQIIGIHHIDYDKKNNKETNLITLCNVCNSMVNYHREKWQNIFIQKIARLYLVQEVVNV